MFIFIPAKMTTSLFTDHFKFPYLGLFKSIIERFLFFSNDLFSWRSTVYEKLFPLPGIHLALDLRHPLVSNVFLMYYALYNVVFVSLCQLSQYTEMHLRVTVEISESKSNLDWSSLIPYHKRPFHLPKHQTNKMFLVFRFQA